MKSLHNTNSVLSNKIRMKNQDENSFLEVQIEIISKRFPW